MKSSSREWRNRICIYYINSPKTALSNKYLSIITLNIIYITMFQDHVPINSFLLGHTTWVLVFLHSTWLVIWFIWIWNVGIRATYSWCCWFFWFIESLFCPIAHGCIQAVIFLIINWDTSVTSFHGMQCLSHVSQLCRSGILSLLTILD